MQKIQTAKMKILLCFLVAVFGLCVPETTNLNFYEKRDGALWEDQQEDDENLNHHFESGQQLRIVIGKLWNNLRNSDGTHFVPIRVDRSVLGTQAAKTALSQTLLEYGQKTCIRFVNYSPLQHRDFITFIFRPYGRCYSQIGRQGGNQPVFFNLKCFRPLAAIILRTLGVRKRYKDISEDYPLEEIESTTDFMSYKSTYNLTPMAVAALLRAYRCFEVSTTVVPGTTVTPPSCGQPVVTPQVMIPKIVGGYEAIPGSHPWQVTIRYRKSNRHICGGILISRLWILSATHCFVRYGLNANLYYGYVGKHHLMRKDKDELPVEFSELVAHENFHVPFRNDITLLKVTKPVELSDKIKTLCLPTSIWDVPAPNTMLIVTGWGATFDTGDDSVLRQVKVPLMRADLCKRLYPKVRRGQICAGYRKGGKDSCWGDSGGPLVVEKEPGTYSLVGIVSWGKGCGKADKPGVYTDVAYYVTWITSTTNNV